MLGEGDNNADCEFVKNEFALLREQIFGMKLVLES